MRKKVGVFSWLKGDAVLLAGLALAIVFGVGLTREIIRRRQVGREIASLTDEVRRLQDRRSELQGLITEYQSASAQEREARTKLNLAKPGEKSLLLEQPASNAAVNVSAATTVGTVAGPATTSNPYKWWNYFFGAS